MSEEEFEALLDEENAEIPDGEIEEDDQEAEKDEEVDPRKPVSAKECLAALDSVRRYAQERGMNSYVLSTLKNVEKECFTQLSEGKTQSHITDFFQEVMEDMTSCVLIDKYYLPNG